MDLTAEDCGAGGREDEEAWVPGRQADGAGPAEDPSKELLSFEIDPAQVSCAALRAYVPTAFIGLATTPCCVEHLAG